MHFKNDVKQFQSTCPARGTTKGYHTASPADTYFNPRAPRGARRSLSWVITDMAGFQSTCPARGTTAAPAACVSLAASFQSTCPARGTTLQRLVVLRRLAISIHVPREGHDACRQETSWSSPRFQSTCPARGTTTALFLPQKFLKLFQSTCPARGTTYRIAKCPDFSSISIHVPREGHDYGKHCL